MFGSMKSKLIGESFDTRFGRDGCAYVPDIIDETGIKFFSKKFDQLEVTENFKHRGEATFGIRNLLNIVPEVQELAESQRVRTVVEWVLGKEAKVVRSIFFDKTPEANWKVPFHQDLTISVKGKIETVGFSAWTIKSGIQHVQPPIEILEKMVTIRIHLDDTDLSNGALKVIRGSHKYGRLTTEQIQKLKSESASISHFINSGSALLIRPLILHSSSVTTEPKRRRVIHLEFCAEKLPNGLEWFGS